MDSTNVLQTIGDTYIAMKNNDKIKPGCAFILPQKLFKEYTEQTAAKGLNENSFMGVPILCDETESSETIVFVESAIEGLGTENGADIMSGMVRAYKERLASLQKALTDRLAEEGIVFQNDEAFREFARTQLVIESHGTVDVIFYEGKEFFRIEASFKPKFVKNAN